MYVAELRLLILAFLLLVWGCYKIFKWQRRSFQIVWIKSLFFCKATRFKINRHWRLKWHQFQSPFGAHISSQDSSGPPFSKCIPYVLIHAHGHGGSKGHCLYKEQIERLSGFVRKNQTWKNRWNREFTVFNHADVNESPSAERMINP